MCVIPVEKNPSQATTASSAISRAPEREICRCRADPLFFWHSSVQTSAERRSVRITSIGRRQGCKASSTACTLAGNRAGLPWQALFCRRRSCHGSQFVVISRRAGSLQICNNQLIKNIVAAVNARSPPLLPSTWCRARCIARRTPDSAPQIFSVK